MAVNKTIRSDVHGIFVRINGAVYRPDEIEGEHWMRHRSFESNFTDGEACKVNHVSQSDICKVVIDGQEEYWVSHGPSEAVGGRLLPTEDSWNPSQNPCKKNHLKM